MANTTPFGIYGLEPCAPQDLDRSAAVEEVIAKLQDGLGHVHVTGPPGFGKSATAVGLARRLGSQAHHLRLDRPGAPLEVQFDRLARQIAGPDAAIPSLTSVSWQEGWQTIAELACQNKPSSPVLIIEQAEHVFIEINGAIPPWPEALFERLSIVTISLVPLHLMHPVLSRHAADRATVRLGWFPGPDGVDEFGDVQHSARRPDTQELNSFEVEAGVWIDAYLRARPGADSARLCGVFDKSHVQRRQQVWDGHPLISMVFVQGLLDAIIAGRPPALAADDIRQGLTELAGAPSQALRDRLLPFDVGRDASVSPKAALEIAAAIEKFCSSDTPLTGHMRDWVLASGLVRQADADRLDWSPIARLVVAHPGTDAGRDRLAQWAKRLRAQGRAYLRRANDLARSNDAAFLAAKDAVQAAFCDSEVARARNTEIDVTRSYSIISGRMHSFILQSEVVRKTPPRGEVEPLMARFQLVLFDIDDGEEVYWRNHVRTLSMLGRARHPALAAYERGGEVESDVQTSGHKRRVYVEIAHPPEPVLPGDLERLIADLALPLNVNGKIGGPTRAMEQIVLLAEALDLLHSQGLLHRNLDFEALARNLQTPAKTTQLVLTGFEYAINIRAPWQHGDGLGAMARLRASPWNIACRAPERMVDGGTSIDPSTDVYAMGALGVMLATGLPPDDVLGEVDALLPESRARHDTNSAIHQRDAMHRVGEILHSDLLREDRWDGAGEEMMRLRSLLESCLEIDPARRPILETVAPRLRGILHEAKNLDSSSGPVMRVSYPAGQMGEMLQRIGLLESEINLDGSEGQAYLHAKIKSLVRTCRWMHYRPSGFPRQGDSASEATRQEAKYLLVGPAVVFFASRYRPSETGAPNADLLWLSYAMHRNELHLPGSDDAVDHERRTTIEADTRVSIPGPIEVVRRSDLSEITEMISWEPTLEELRRRTEEVPSLGFEAATVWRVHRDIVASDAALSNFPVTLERDLNSDRGTYTMRLDEDAFRRMNNAAGSYGFFRRLIIQGIDPRAYFLNKISEMAEESSAGRLGLLLYPQAPGRASRPAAATVLQPITEPVRIQVSNGDDGSLPTVSPYSRVVWTDSFGTLTAVERQTRAIDRLMRRTWLLDYLVNPRDCGRLMRDVSPDCGRTLSDDPDEVRQLQRRVSLMLSSDPLHAVQGPPGTGKTTLVSALVAEAVRARDGARILVTSQSHAATDNVLRSVMSTLSKVSDQETTGGSETQLALRVFSDATRASVDPYVAARYSIHAQATAAQRRMRKSAERFDGAPKGSKMDEAVRYLRKAATEGYIELRFKLERAAPIVFSTTGAAMTSLDFLRRGALGYDYVLVDEAAKAWAIDLVQPLSIADRAILVGDQAQLPPFGELGIDRILKSAAALRGVTKMPPDVDDLLDTTRQPNRDSDPIERMKNHMRPFHHIFEARPPDLSDVTKGIPLTQRLDRQFRSVDAIGTLVSHCFYNDTIRNAGRDPELDLRLPITLLSGFGEIRPSIAWIDTGQGTSEGEAARSRSRGTGGIYNPYEAALVCDLVSCLPLFGTPDPASRLRILSPYRAQVNELEKQFRMNPGRSGLEGETLSRLFGTVDSSQGSEAEIVVISLARRFALQNMQSSDAEVKGDRLRDALKRQVDFILGFLQQPERLNVMMSRARQSLIIVGDFEYYRRGEKALGDYRFAANGHMQGDRQSFWSRLLNMFVRFDPDVHTLPDASETPILLPANLIARSNP